MTFIKSLVFGVSLISSGAILTDANAKAIGGVSLGATRMIYPINAKQISLPILNNSLKDRYLVNTWIDNVNGEKTKDILITPPIFVSEANTENTLRIIKIIDSLPQDRESIYYINVKTIPSVSTELLENSNILQLAVLSRIKLFVRPKNLPFPSEDALKYIKFVGTPSGVEVENSSPYFISFVNIKVDGEVMPHQMVAPLATTKISSKKGSTVSYQVVNDYGGLAESVDYSLTNK